jgi:hypothetical protein
MKEIKVLKQSFKNDMTSFQKMIDKRIQELFQKVDLQKLM